MCCYAPTIRRVARARHPCPYPAWSPTPRPPPPQSRKDHGAVKAGEAPPLAVGTGARPGNPKSEPPDVWRFYGASVAPVLPAAAEMFLGAWQHGTVGEYPVNLYL